MNEETLSRLSNKLSDSPILRAAALPSPNEVEAAAEEIGIPFPSDYREFLLKFGGAMVGPYPIYGLRPVEVMGWNEWSVVEMTKRSRKNNILGTENWAIVSTDHAGNPIGIDRDGLIWVHDHDFGGVALLVDNFEEYIRVWCWGLAPS
ncbi:SMI1/KNR4 family protein [Planctomicrobium piriforme]|uniref:SMI1-KNR4 cell-wall n=1 Tax=Planctomicrobium piriforme TaxID=1576369 RepID=A0A1I3PD41_9PLAN|nr:SMI1/KNR4 family protein [Planctomicrobium piriforme]SFJ19309.1 SMI1-KNR4 cell-wall [Planctomicrobium piriforme]